ncbi:MAG: hypothetical protein IPL65_09030 [Lewinellaceae bacterium]|nr:hypothetical protein [Lewinellaceae bacterium]
MKKAFRILAYIFGFLLLLVLGLAGYVQWKFNHLPAQKVTPLAIHAVTDSATIIHGARIVTTLCAGCHIGNDGTLSGQIFLDPKEGFGTIWSANITQHPEKGIGKYTDGELAWAIRSGINREGRYLGPFMQHPLMSDSELTAIVSFLRSDTRLTQPSEAVHPPAEYAFVFRALIALGMMDPIPVATGPLSMPEATDEIAYGKHLATVTYTCANCHSASFETNVLNDMEKSEGFMGGGNPIDAPDHSAKILSANITPSKPNGIGNWTYEQFEQAVRSGKSPIKAALAQPCPGSASWKMPR